MAIPTLSRRDYLTLSAAGVIGFSMSGWLKVLADGTAKDRKRKRSCILLWMNGAAAGGLARSRTVTALADFPLMTTAERVEALYLATLSRKPRPGELERFVKYVDRGGALADGKEPQEKDKTAALADVLWVLLNSAEFKVNH